MIKSILLVAYLSGASLDVATTCVAMNRGFSEGNPMFGSSAGCGRVAAIKSITTGGVVYLVEKKVKTRKGKIIAYAVVGAVNMVPVALNMRAINHVKR